MVSLHLSLMLITGTRGVLLGRTKTWPSARSSCTCCQHLQRNTGCCESRHTLPCTAPWCVGQPPPRRSTRRRRSRRWALWSAGSQSPSQRSWWLREVETLRLWSLQLQSTMAGLPHIDLGPVSPWSGKGPRWWGSNEFSGLSGLCKRATSTAARSSRRRPVTCDTKGAARINRQL